MGDRYSTRGSFFASPVFTKQNRLPYSGYPNPALLPHPPLCVPWKDPSLDSRVTILSQRPGCMFLATPPFTGIRREAIGSRSGTRSSIQQGLLPRGLEYLIAHAEREVIIESFPQTIRDSPQDDKEPEREVTPIDETSSKQYT